MFQAILSRSARPCWGFALGHHSHKDWIGGDALDEMLSDFPIDIEWENYADRASGKYDIVFSWEIDPDTLITW